MLFKIFSIGLLSFFCSISFADDTELYSVNIGDENGLRPQVLVIFDNSGSMDSDEWIQIKPYVASTNYGGDNNKVYWSDDGRLPSSDQYLKVNENYCQSSLSELASIGKYIGNVRYWVVHRKQKKSKWQRLSENKTGLFDCKEDVSNQLTNNPNNIIGYPDNGKDGPYSNRRDTTIFNSDGITLYSANYLAWKKLGNIGSWYKTTRLEIAQEAITNLIAITPSVDFGLAVFNYNNGDSYYNKNGGKIVDKVMTRDEPQTKELIGQINALTADTWTPLCETMYEAYRYYAGKEVYFGDDDSYRTPYRDATVEKNGVYKSPMKNCQERSYIILMTDGVPSYDSAANSNIKSLTGKGAILGSYMPSLAQWMNNSDIDADASNGNQHISTYTIGFGQSAVDDAGALLAKTASLGGGEYFPATDADALQNAFQSVLIDILNTTSSLTSPAIASNNFDRTQSLDSVYYSMFMPDNKAVWQGNIKKLKINSSGILVGPSGKPAIDADGNIKEGISTFWGGDKDGNTVSEGGVTEMLENVQTRKILSNLTGGILQSPNLENLKRYYELKNNAELASLFGIEEAELSNSLNWLQGLDVDDQDTDNDKTDYRANIFADPMHSKPLAITYVEGGKQIVRILAGTNAGFLHMFTDNENALNESGVKTNVVSENWAFIPEELLDKGLSLRGSADSLDHQYGMDLSPIAIKTYTNGKVSKIIAIMGMRRGGTSYYALDITLPDAPKLLWTIDSSMTGFEELSQTWSIPSVGSFSYKKGSSEIVTPGIVFGGGYDTNKDTCDPSDNQQCNKDSSGRAVYIVNALTGQKIWSVDGSTCDDANIHCMQDSIPSQIGIFDSNDDGYIDRLYTGDTGGNVWRMDLVGTDRTHWSTIKLAELGGDSSTTDRRFFNAPVIVQTYSEKVSESNGLYSFNKVAYDGILLSSGDRAHPASSTSVNDATYLLHDYKIKPTLFGQEGYANKPTPLTVSNFYDITNNPVGSNTGNQLLDVYADMSGSSGWKYRLTSVGEKSLGQGSILEGTVYFTSFVPNSTINISCGITDIGEGWLYAVNLHTGTLSLTNDAGSDTTVAKQSIGSRVPDTLVIHAGVDENGNSALRLLGVGQGDAITIIDETTGETEKVYTGTVDTQEDMMPRRIYSFFYEK